MKREKIIAKAQELAVKAFCENVAIHTNMQMYPKCYVCELVAVENEAGCVCMVGGKGLTPQMKPTELCAYLEGYIAGKEAAK